MPWREVSVMEQRREFVRLALQDGVNRRELFRRFGIHPATGYKWLNRWKAGQEDLTDRSRRPQKSPKRSDVAIEERVLAVRDAHPAWGARKIVRCLERDGVKAPAASTVHEILRRHDRIVPPLGGPRAIQRFEKPAPNLLWQMDFKGRKQLTNGGHCHPLTIVDDHSRYALCLEACANEQGSTVQQRLQMVFRRYGLPEAFFVDNGSPWGDASGHRWTYLRVWLLKLGIEVLHSRPYHPQSRGKNERFHRTLEAEVFAFKPLCDLSDAQRAFDTWRHIYNFDRPHEALGQDVPANAIGRAPVRCPIACLRSNMTSMRSCAAYPPPRHICSSRGDCGKCRKPSAGSVWLFGRSPTTASTAFSSPPITSQIST
jgi:transposase InsO family protein